MASFFRRNDPDRPTRSHWGLTLTGLAGGIAIAAAAYSFYWFAMAGQLRKAAEDWRESVRAEGGVAEWRSLAVTGYPLWLRAEVTAPRLGRPLAEQPWLWQAPRAGAAMRPWNFNRVSINLSGQHELQVTVDERTVPLTGAAEALTVELERRPARAWEARLALGGLNLVGPSDVGDIAVASAEGSVRRLRPPEEVDHQAATWALALQGQQLTLPDTLVLPLGREVGRFSIAARLLGDLPPGPLADGLATWRDAGGTVEVGKLEAAWGPLAIQGDGTLALDGDLQPIGAFTAKAQGFFEALEMLRRQGLVDGRDAMTATVVLGVMSRRPANGGPASLSLPISLQGRQIFAGPVAVARLPEVRWTGTMPDL